jgi:hypothetical protein
MDAYNRLLEQINGMGNTGKGLNVINKASTLKGKELTKNKYKGFNI